MLSLDKYRPLSVGLFSDDSFLPDVPYEVRMPVMSSQECNLIKEENEIYEWYNFDHNICARDLRLGSDVCRVRIIT